MTNWRLVLASLPLLCTSTVAAQQQYLNLDFETAGYLHSNEPWGWRRIPWGASVGTVRLDTLEKHHGRQSLRIERSAGRPIGYDLMLSALDADLRGKELTLAGWVRSSGLSGGTFRLRLSASEAGDSVLIGEQSSPNQWEPIYVRIQVPNDEEENVELRFDMRAEGVIWVDHLELRVNGTRVDSLPRGQQPSPAQRAWVLQNATHLGAADTGSFVDDPVPLFPMFAAARVIGLGETTHGTSEFQKTKTSFIEFAARHLGVTVVAMEESQLTADRLNDWIHGGPGELEALMTDIYNMWRTEEMVEMFEWMRTYNRSGAGRLELVGIDVTNIAPELDSVLTMLPSIDPAYATVAATRLRPIKEAWETRAIERPHPPDTVALWRTVAEAVLAHVQSNDERYRASGDSARSRRLARYAHAVVQSIMVYQTNGNDLAGRDSMMAANLMRELDARGPATRAVISAHGTHVSRMPGRMGEHLQRSLGSAYLPVALTTFQGEYSALVTTNGGPPLRMVAVPLHPAFPGSIEEMLHRVGAPRLVLDLRKADRKPAESWLLGGARMREIGILAVDLPRTRQLADYWDLIIHIDLTRATRFVRCPRGMRCWFPG